MQRALVAVFFQFTAINLAAAADPREGKQPDDGTPCTPCEVIFGGGRVIKPSELGCGPEKPGNKAILDYGAYDLPKTASAHSCRKHKKCAFELEDALPGFKKKKVWKVKPEDDLPQEFLMTRALQEEWLNHCQKHFDEIDANDKWPIEGAETSKNATKFFRQKDPETDTLPIFAAKWGHDFPDSLYNHVADRLCLVGGNWGRLRVTRMTCHRMPARHKIPDAYALYGPDGRGQKDPLAQAMARLYIDTTEEDGQIQFHRMGEKPHRATDLDVNVNGTFLAWDTFTLFSQKPHFDTSKYTVTIDINFVSEDLFRASYYPRWYFSNGWGPAGTMKSKMYWEESGFFKPGEMVRADESKVEWFENGVPLTALKRDIWPIAHLTTTPADKEELLKTFIEAEKKVMAKLRKADTYKELEQQGVSASRSRLFAWYGSPGEVSKVEVHSKGEMEAIDCSLGCTVDQLANQILGYFTAGTGKNLPPPPSWDYENKKVFPKKPEKSKRAKNIAKQHEKEKRKREKRAKKEKEEEEDEEEEEEEGAKPEL